jgi:DNA-binding transcriptional MerR regulator/methylmalonyl-CoA mutase cobalamin-binding subunit
MPNTPPTSTRYLIQTVAKRAGLKPDLIRAWERRYRAVEPVRSEGGQRLYSDEDIRRLSLLNQATRAGHSIGRIAGLPIAELEGLLRTEKVRDFAAAPQPATMPGVSAERYVDDCYAAVVKFDTDLLEAHLEAAIAELGVLGFVDRLIVPLMQRVGENWQSGLLRPVHEHLASVSIRSMVYLLRAQYPKAADAPCAVVATPVNQLHELGTLFASIVAESNGWRSVYLGPNLPAEEIAAAVKFAKAQAVILGIGHTEHAATLGKELRRLKSLAGGQSALIVGGQAAVNYRPLLAETGARHVNAYTDLRQVLADLRREWLLNANSAENTI